MVIYVLYLHLYVEKIFTRFHSIQYNKIILKFLHPYLFTLFTFMGGKVI